MRLTDGRRVSYAEFGDPDGVPVVNCHGASSSRCERYFPDGEEYRRLGVRAGGIDRPGSGRSDSAPGRRIVDWPADARQVLDGLGLGEVRVLALSPARRTRWPWAARCWSGSAGSRWSAAAHRRTCRGPGRPCRLPSARCCAGRLSTAASLPVLGPAALHPPLFASYLRRRLGPTDRKLLDRPDVRRRLEETFAEGLRQGWRPGAYDRALLRRPWGFAVRQVPRPTQLWHGRADWQAPLPGVRLLAAEMPTAPLRVLPGAGRLLGFHHGAEILTDLTAP